MSRCRHCERKRDRPSPWADRTKECFDALLPALRMVAYRSGYALAVHGSIEYDIDLIAVPWRPGASPAEHLAEKIRQAADVIVGQAFVAPGDEGRLPEKKPHGRLAWSFHLGGGPYIDLSVMPPIADPPAPATKKQHKT